MAEDIFLSGGNVAATVVRRGDTLRKPPTPFDAATTALLHHYASAGLDGVPRALGIDTDGRILSFLPGDTAFPPAMWEDDVTLTSAAAILRKIHDASVPLVGQNHDWAYAYPDAARHEVICHNDFAPYNMAFAPDGSVAGVFDFDLAGPGPRQRDLAYLAWWLVPFGRTDETMRKSTERDIANGSPRLTALCAAYGTAPDGALLNMITHVLTHMSDPQITEAMIGPEAAQRLADGGHFAQWRAARDDFASVRPRIAANLGLSPGG